MMQSKLQRTLSIFLALVLLVQLIPVQALSLESISVDKEESSGNTAAEMVYQSAVAVNDAQIVAELPEGRGEFQKEFLLDNGMQMLAMYGRPVHYKENGEWKEIDNTLRLTAGQVSMNGLDTGAVYRNTAGIWEVSLPASLNANTPVTVSREGYSLSFRFTGELHNNHVIMGVEETEKVVVVVPETLPEASTSAESTKELSASGADDVFVESVGMIPPIVEPTEETDIAKDELVGDSALDTATESTEASVNEIESPGSADNTEVGETNNSDLSIHGFDPVEIVETVELVRSAAARITAVEMPVDHSGSDREETMFSKLNTALTYENIYSNTDLRYDLISHVLKESVIIKSACETLAGYSYTLSAEGLVLELQEDSSILAYAADGKERNEPVFIMPAPYLVDAADSYCDDVSVSLTGSNGRYTLTYRLPRQWMTDNARVYPVTLDPVVEGDARKYLIEDQSVFEYNQFGYLWEKLEAGYDPGYGRERIFIKFDELPELGAADVIVSAKLKLCKISDTGAETMEAHEVLGPWRSNTINWSNKPACNSLVEDFQRVSAAGWYTWDITAVAQKWYDTDKNYGVMLRMSPAVEEGNSSNYHQFHSSDAYSNTPALYITYLNNCGLENYWDYASHRAGRAGTGHINKFTGNLVWVHDGLSFSGNRMPISISSIYNANDKGKNSFGLGYGWRTNYNQRVSASSVVDNYYVWLDEDGTRRFFKKETSTKYVNELDSNLILTVKSTNSPKYTITDKDGNVRNFDSEGRLISIVNNQETKSPITITYKPSTLHINTIKDGAGRKYQFNYTDDTKTGRLTSIVYYGTGSSALSTLVYECDEKNNLVSIGYPDGEAVTYSYIDNTHLLSSATDIDGYSVSYAYTTTASTKPNRISQVTEKDDTVPGGSLEISYAHNQTVFTDHNDRTEILQFNNYGSTVSVQDDQGRAQFAQYAGNNSRKSASQLTLSSKLQNTVVDLIRDGSFELSTSNWAKTSDSDGAFSFDTSTKYLEKKSLKVTAGSIPCTVRPATTYYATAEPGQSYTLSAYVKAPSGTAASISLRLSGSTTPLATTAAANSSDWQRIEVTYTHPATSAAAPLVACLSADSGTVWFDCVQLEQSATASRYNIVEDGDFRFHGSTTANHYAWLPGAHCTATEKRTALPAGEKAAAPHMNTTAYTITGTSVKQRNIYQDVRISGSAGDVYSFGGWAKGDSVPISGSGLVRRKFSLTFCFIYPDGTDDVYEVDFNTDCDKDNNWQFVSARFVAPEDYSALMVMLSYNYNRNTAYFDGIQLFKEEFGQSYAYDEETGLVESTIDLQGRKTEYKYTSNQLTKAILPNGVIEEYTYDSYNNVKTAKTSTGVTATFTYDTYGNNTSVTVTNGGKTLSSSAVYTNSDNYSGSSEQYGNYLFSVTDPLGKTTTYGYNADTGVLDWVQAPGETEATRTNYTYDNLYRTTGVTKDGSTVGYTYTNDLLDTITSASGTVYDFTYGDFDLVQNVKIGSRTLISHEYSDNADRYLTKSTYGNGNFIAYTYDDLGRAESKTYEDGDKIEYAYDNNGNLGQVTDSGSGRTTRYYYDFLDRIGRVEERGGTYSNVTQYTYNAQSLLSKSVQSIQPLTAYTDDYTTTYAYDTDNRPTSVVQGGGTYGLHYDGLGRMDQTTVKHEGTTVLTTTIGYNGTDTAASTQVSTWTNSVGETATVYSYTYDDRGNITAIHVGDTLVAEYTYDSLDQLIREDNQAAGKTWIYTYEQLVDATGQTKNGGNITSKKEYEYTTEALGDVVEEFFYRYTDGAWKDLLIYYGNDPTDNENNTKFTYDTIGNLTNDGTWAYTWEHGRQLAGMSKAGTNIAYTYNADGLRSTKTVGSTVYQYYYDPSGQLTDILWGSNKLHFAYDALGPVAVTYNGIRHYYLRNAQGDITGIINYDREQVVAYTYDAWGNVLSVTGTMADTLGAANPLRYRGYLYDSETGLYYLQSRYYNPAWGRFINADNESVLSASPSSATWDKNLFAYCDNNPISRKDDGGAIWHVVIGAAVGGLVSGGMSVLTNYLSGQPMDWGQIAIDTFFGAMGGILTATGAGFAAGVACDVLENYTSQVYEIQSGTRTEISYSYMVASVTIGAGYSKYGDKVVDVGLEALGNARDQASRNAARYASRASNKAAIGESSSYYTRRAMTQNKLSNQLSMKYTAAKTAITSFISSLNIF